LNDQCAQATQIEVNDEITVYSLVDANLENSAWVSICDLGLYSLVNQGVAAHGIWYSFEGNGHWWDFVTTSSPNTYWQYRIWDASTGDGCAALDNGTLVISGAVPPKCVASK
jgi:hypothetical protein